MSKIKIPKIKNDVVEERSTNLIYEEQVGVQHWHSNTFFFFSRTWKYLDHTVGLHVCECGGLSGSCHTQILDSCHTQKLWWRGTEKKPEDCSKKQHSVSLAPKKVQILLWKNFSRWGQGYIKYMRYHRKRNARSAVSMTGWKSQKRSGKKWKKIASEYS